MDNPADLKKVIFNKHDKITELEYFNSFLEESLKKRESLMKAYFEENTKLKEELRIRDKNIERLNEELRTIRNLFPMINSAFRKKTSNATERSLYTNKSRNTPERRSVAQEQSMTHHDLMTGGNESLEYKNEHKSPLRDSILQTEEDAHNYKKISGSRKVVSTKATDESVSRIVKMKGYADSPEPPRHDESYRKKPGRKSSQGKTRVRTVTETQGRRDLQSLFTDNFKKTSILQMSITLFFS